MTNSPAVARNHWAASVGAGALAVVLFASSEWVPLAGIALCLASPLPVALAAARGGIAGAGVASLSGALGSLVLTGPIGSAVFTSQFAASGCALGLAARARCSPEVVVGAYSIVAIAAFWAMLGVAGASTGIGGWGLLQGTVDQAVEAASEFLLRGESQPEAALAVQAWAENARHLLPMAFPGLFALLATLTGWANCLLLRRLMGELRGAPWTQWRAPERWIWVLIASGLIALFGGGPLGATGLNIFIAAIGVYLLQGVAVVQSWFEAKGVPPLFRIAAYALLFFQFPVTVLVAAVGAFDLWIDFRSRWTPRPPESTTPSSENDDSPDRRRIP